MVNVGSEQIFYLPQAAVTSEKQQAELCICQTETMQNNMWDSRKKHSHIKANLLAPKNSSSVPPARCRSSYFSPARATMLARWSLLAEHTQPSWLLSFPAQVLVEAHGTSAPGCGSRSPRYAALWVLIVTQRPNRARAGIQSWEPVNAPQPSALDVPSSSGCWHL